MTATRAISPRADVWRLQTLNWGSAIFAVAAFLVVSQLNLAPSSLRTMLNLLVTVVAVAAVWRAAPYTGRVLACVLAMFGFQMLAALYRSLAPSAFMMGTLAVFACGLLLSLRWAVSAWLISTLGFVASAFLLAGDYLDLPQSETLLDPHHLATGIRYAFTYTVLSAAIALGVSAVMSRLSKSLSDVKKALRDLEEEQRERARAELALRASETEWRSVVESAPDLISIVDRDHRVRFMNRTAIGYTMAQVLGARVEQFMDTEDAKGLSRAIDFVFETGEIRSIKCRARGPGGEEHWFTSRLGPTLKSGEVDRVILVSADTTDAHKMEELLRRSQKMQVIGELTGGISHDFNNYLTVILGNLDLLSAKLGPDHPQQRLATKALEAANRGATLTERLLAYARKQTLRPEALDLKKLVAGMRVLLQGALGETVLETRSGKGLWRCQADPSQLENVMLNLAFNARDAMPEGGSLLVACANARVAQDDVPGDMDQVAAGDYVTLSFTDSGTGMSHEVVEQAYDPFFTTKDVGDGSSLGLSMVYGF